MKNQQSQNSGKLYKLTLVAAVAQPMMTLPQVVQLYTTHDASGLSLLTWAGYSLLGLIFLAYGIKFNLRPIIVAQVIWFTLQSAVAIGIAIWS